MITYLKGDVTKPIGNGPRIIGHICNDRGGYGKGVALAIARRWDTSKRYFKGWYASKDGFGLGKTQFVEVEPNLWVANMVAQSGYKSGNNLVPIRYESLKVCLEELALEAEQRKASIHMPRIGTGLAGSSWDIICPIIEETLTNRLVYIYDF